MGRAYIPSAGNVCGGLSPKEGPQQGSATLHAEHPGLCRGLWEQELLSLSPCNPASAFRCTEGTPGRSEPGKLRPREVKGPPEVTRQVWASLPPASCRLQAVRERKRMGSPGEGSPGPGPVGNGAVANIGAGVPPASLLLVSGRH